MKKILIMTSVMVILATPLASAFAQEQMILPACTDEELAATLEGIAEAHATFEEVATAFDLSSDPSSNDYGVTLVVLEAFNSAYWDAFFNEVPECAEAVGIAYVVGSFYEDYLVTGLLLNLAGWADAAGETALASQIAADAATRLADVEAAAALVSGMTFEELATELFADDLPACTADQLSAAEAAFEEAYAELSAIEEQYADDSAALFAATDAAAYAFDSEVYSELSTCSELAYIADAVSITLNLGNSIAGLYANAEIEAAAGNTEVAEAMNSAAQAREAVFDELVGMLESE